jgi:hypothetical protein
MKKRKKKNTNIWLEFLIILFIYVFTQGSSIRNYQSSPDPWQSSRTWNTKQGNLFLAACVSSGRGQQLTNEIIAIIPAKQ